MVDNIAIRRYHLMGSLDLGRQTADDVARVVFWWNRERANGSYGLIRISANGIVRAAC